MIKSKKYYWLICDECSERCPNPLDDHQAWAEPDHALMYASDDGWERKNGKDYCYECRDDE